MITDTGTRICDQEIRAVGSNPWMWKGCRKPAVFSIPSKHSAGMYLDYCKCHAPLCSRCKGKSVVNTMMRFEKRCPVCKGTGEFTPKPIPDGYFGKKTLKYSDASSWISRAREGGE